MAAFDPISAFDINIQASFNFSRILDSTQPHKSDWFWETEFCKLLRRLNKAWTVWGQKEKTGIGNGEEKGVVF